MRDQLALLWQLQQLDEQVHALRLEQQKLPQQAQQLEQGWREAQEALARIKADIEQSERQQRTLDRELESQQAALSKMQSKLREVKTNKEYSAVLAEIAACQERIGACEDRLLQVMEQTEQQRHVRRQHEQDVHRTEDELASRRQALQKVHDALAVDIATEYDKRRHTISQLKTEVVKAYEKLATRHGRAVVQLHDGTCGGCHLKVRPQLISDIRQQNALHACPHCRLLLLWPEET